MPPAKCPYLHRCNKYTDLTCQIDRLREASLAKDREIARLKAENERLKAAQCGGGQTSSKALPFGSSTPSSKIPLKPNSSEESRRRLGGRNTVVLRREEWLRLGILYARPIDL